jgi:hypothetical protein
VVFTFTVSHAPTSDNSPVSNVTVTDDYAGAASLVANGDGDSLLEAGETWLFTAGYTILPTTPNPFTNTGVVSARSGSNNPIFAQAKHTANVSGFDPDLFVDKDGPATARVGDTVVFTFTVINVNLQAVQLFDLGPIGIAAVGDGSPLNMTSIQDITIGKAGNYVGGDFNNNNKLDGAEAWVYTASYVIPAGGVNPLFNTVVVAGRDPEGDQVSATDIHITEIVGLQTPSVILYLPTIFKNASP